MKKFLIGLTLSSLILIPVTSVSASENSNGGTWSNEIRFTVNSGGTTSWSNAGVSTASNKKATESGSWDVNVLARTMSSRPLVRLSNSSGSALSNSITVPSNNGTAIGTGNTVKTGETCRSQVRPAFNQATNSQTMRYKFSAR
ncbi:hypothetical protein [Alkalihalobacillus sp. LMS39]|uniref:hypothetical protein n=1 Tax=Alkalihalobacillus sp. LMS39 TaxID=2924032 RepID=UPI001FB55898|nr:hypothetical protein [Alkalihalobacillus sp. LMS39]UOE94744.1 hypothetical protein MM271_03605 [Alkalihalobacillus sp. LMS39]